MKKNVLNIQRFCTSDGPGIRTTVFMKGCPLRCLWCHNPESQRSVPELAFDADKCVNCMRCIQRCENGCHTQKDHIHKYIGDDCTACGKCTSPLCSALELFGYETDAHAIISEVMKDVPFYKSSGGGLTLSGGEPLAQPNLACEILKLAKENGIHTAVETCGYADNETVLRVAELTDLFLFDLKETDRKRHKELTGVDNGLILDNLRLLNAKCKQIVLRCPIIPTLNDREDHVSAIAELVNSLPCILRVEIAPYHTFGIPKYARLGRSYKIGSIAPPSDSDIDLIIKKLRDLTEKPVVRA